MQTKHRKVGWELQIAGVGGRDLSVSNYFRLLCWRVTSVAASAERMQFINVGTPTLPTVLSHHS